jgi:uncharacterized protein YbjT (DUF2867 family)
MADLTKRSEDPMSLSPVLVTGGTGRLGHRVVRLLGEAGCPVRVLTRQSRVPANDISLCVGDLRTGEGLEAATDGVSSIVHCATSTKGDAEAALNLLAAVSSSAPHLVYVSIVGLEKVGSWGYPKAKLQTERLVVESGLPWTILRATQFYEYILIPIQKLALIPVTPVPAGFRVQPVDAEDVAARLVELVLAEPAGRVRDLAGPQVSDWADLLRDYLRIRHQRRLVVPVRIPGTRTVRSGGLLPPSEHDEGRRTWEQFLVARLQDQGAVGPG